MIGREHWELFPTATPNPGSWQLLPSCCALSFVLAVIAVQGCTLANGTASTGGTSAAANADPVVARISMSGFPWHVSISDATVVYVVNGAGKVSVIDTASNQLAGVIQMRHQAARIAVALDGGRVYVSSTNDGTVSVVDTKTRQEVSTIEVGGHPGALAITPDGSLLYVTDLSHWIVSVVDLATERVGPPIHLPNVQWPPLDIAVAPDGRWAYVVGCIGYCATGTLWVIDTTTNSSVDTVSVGADPSRLAVSPDGKFICVTSERDATVSVINTATRLVTATVTVQPQPMGIAIDREGKRAYVTNLRGGSLSVIDIASGTVVATVPVGVAPKDIALTPDGAFAYVANFNAVALIDLRRIASASDLRG